MPGVPVITLTTDFGYKDPLAAIMKGVILGINPSVNIVDITHLVGKYQVREAALIIGMSYREFPARSIHVAVTDPGVGSPRRPLLVEAEGHYFIGPDNGVFSMVYLEAGTFRATHLTSTHYFGPKRSTTFHGRDIFAPVAAWLSKGIESSKFGEPITDFVKFDIPSPSFSSANALEGEVIYIDTYGNAITNIRVKDIEKLRFSL